MNSTYEYDKKINKAYKNILKEVKKDKIDELISDDDFIIQLSNNYNDLGLDDEHVKKDEVIDFVYECNFDDKYKEYGIDKDKLSQKDKDRVLNGIIKRLYRELKFGDISKNQPW